MYNNRQPYSLKHGNRCCGSNVNVFTDKLHSATPHVHIFAVMRTTLAVLSACVTVLLAQLHMRACCGCSARSPTTYCSCTLCGITPSHTRCPNRMPKPKRPERTNSTRESASLSGRC